jgi:hypothetical protein
MTIMTRVTSALGPSFLCGESERGLRVSTHCLYPSNTTVTVTVTSRGDGQYRVDDDAQAIGEVSQTIYTTQDLKKLMKRTVHRFGCEITDQGQIVSPIVAALELKAALVIVANASKAAAEHLLSNVRPPRRDMKKSIEELLERKFKNQWLRDGKIVGASNKPHGFDYIVRLANGRQFVFDFVVPDASSVNSAVVAHLDVKQKQDPTVEQRIIYDESQAWQAEDLQLLKVGARPATLSSLEQLLDKLAA